MAFCLAIEKKLIQATMTSVEIYIENLFLFQLCVCVCMQCLWMSEEGVVSYRDPELQVVVSPNKVAGNWIWVKSS